MRVRFIPSALIVFSAFTIFTSCQKEVSVELGGSNNGSGNGNGGGNTTTNIAGDYDFVGMHAHTLSTVTATVAGEVIKTVTESDYFSKNNIGTVKITASELINTNVGYSIDTTMHAKMYIDGALIDDSDYPFVATVPPTSSTSTYVRNSADSITATGSFGSTPDPTGNAPTGPVGIKLSWSGDTLIMKSAATFTQNINQGGVPATFVGSVSAVTKLKKK